MDVNLSLQGGKKAAAAARNAVGGLAGHIPEDVLEDVRLLVSELVTNSVRHGGASDGRRVHVRLTIAGPVLRVEVRDPGPGFVPREPRGRLERASGWGLVLVDRIADRWGVERGPGAKVWFEIGRYETGRDDRLLKIPA
jgi:anti-sigma regulatory factor (Ser/Thr protein kinase)